MPPGRMQEAAFEVADGTAAGFAGLVARGLLLRLLPLCSSSVSILFRPYSAAAAVPSIPAWR
jgi:hypothetical protein